MKKSKLKSLVISLLLSLGTGAAAGILTSDSMAKYEALCKPPLSPPGWVFPVVWTILYTLMGIAAWLVWNSDSEDKKQALGYYAAQLFVNAVWPILFFRLDWHLTAFVWLLLLWYLVFVTTRMFYKINPLAGKLMVVYLIWITFAGYLNGAQVACEL